MNSRVNLLTIAIMVVAGTTASAQITTAEVPLTRQGPHLISAATQSFALSDYNSYMGMFGTTTPTFVHDGDTSVVSPTYAKDEAFDENGTLVWAEAQAMCTFDCLTPIEIAYNTINLTSTSNSICKTTPLNTGSSWTRQNTDIFNPNSLMEGPMTFLAPLNIPAGKVLNSDLRVATLGNDVPNGNANWSHFNGVWGASQFAFGGQSTLHSQVGLHTLTAVSFAGGSWTVFETVPTATGIANNTYFSPNGINIISFGQQPVPAFSPVLQGRPIAVNNAIEISSSYNSGDPKHRIASVLTAAAIGNP